MQGQLAGGRLLEESLPSQTPAPSAPVALIWGSKQGLGLGFSSLKQCPALPAAFKEVSLDCYETILFMSFWLVLWAGGRPCVIYLFEKLPVPRSLHSVSSTGDTSKIHDSSSLQASFGYS